MIYLSDSAIQRLEEMNKSWIKIAVFFGGCNGFKYDFSFPSNPKEDDLTFNHGNKGIIVDKFTFTKIENATVDFVDNLMESKFHITSNNFKKTCHCGTSFKA